MAAKAVGRKSNGEGSIFQRTDGRWVAMITVGINPNGTIKRKSLYGKTKAEVIEKKKIAEAEQTTGLPVARQDITIEKLMTEYLADVKPTLRPKTFHSYSQLSRLHIVPRLGHIKLAKLDARDIGKWQRDLAEAGLSSQSVKLARSCLSRAVGMGMRFDWIARNVVALAKAPSVVHKPTPDMGQGDAQKIVAAFTSHRFEGLVLLLIGCGLRISEALGLCWTDIDMDNRTLTVRHQLTRASGANTGAFVLASPKTKTGFRTVPLPPFVIEALQRQHKAQLDSVRDVVEAGETWQNEWGLVFTCGMGQPIAYRNVMRQFSAVLKRHGIVGLTPHDLRHLHASLLASQGITAKSISDTLGHSQINITMDRYTHALRGVDSGISGAIQTAVKPSPSTSKTEKSDPIAVRTAVKQ